jgi:TonB family protein
MYRRRISLATLTFLCSLCAALTSMAFAQTGADSVAKPPKDNSAASNALVVTKKTDPEYSPEARAAGLQGTVLMTLTVTPEGFVDNVQVRRGLGFNLDERAVAAVRQWQYKPTPNGRSQMDIVEVPFQFDPPGQWRIVGSRFTPIPPVRGPFGKPVLTGYLSPDNAACTKGPDYVPVDLQIGTDGKPAGIAIRPTIDKTLAEAAIEAARAWTFQAGTISGVPEVSSATILLECRGPGSLPVATLPVGTSPVATSTQSPSGGIVRIGAGVSQPSVLFKVDPAYSEEARKAKLSGQVLLSVVVDSEGRPQDIHLVKALGMGLDEEALVAVRQWRFTPGKKDSNPVNVRATIAVNFRLL